MRKKTVLIILSVLLGVAYSFAAGTFTLVIDAGHGGHDTGAKGAYSQEKDINLRVALAFGQYVEQNCNDVKVIYTRTSDVFIPLKQRANIANRNNADLFISVHTNALAGGRIVRGFEVYTLGMHRAKDNLDVAMRENSVIEEEDNYQQVYQGFDPKSSESYIMFEFMQSANMQKSVELAKLIENSACETADRVNMGVHQAGFLVLRETSMPSCLIELGFITTPDEEDFLNTDDGTDKLAYGIYKAFVEYKQKYSNKAISGRSSTPAKVAQPKTTSAKVTPTTTTKPAPQKARAEAKREKPKQAVQKTAKGNEPVFKVQVFAIAKKLATDDPIFKGHKDIDSYSTAGSQLTKYTIGSTADYNKITDLCSTLKTDFPQAYVVAFKNGSPMSLTEAINEYKNNKRKQSSKQR